MLETVLAKIVQSISDPFSLAMTLFVVYLIYEKREYKKDCSIVMTALLKAQEERGITLTKISMTIDQLLRSSGRPA